jgi:hypothetical protein
LDVHVGSAKAGQLRIAADLVDHHKLEARCGIGSCGVPRPRLADYVAGTGPRGAAIAAEGASVGYSLALIYSFFVKYYVAGLTAGAVKG